MPPPVCGVKMKLNYITMAPGRSSTLVCCPRALRLGLPEKLIPTKLWVERFSPEPALKTPRELKPSCLSACPEVLI